MFTLYKKELTGFFSSITGYIVIIIFLLANSLFMWIFPGELNILDSGFATLDTLFIMAPWVFLFLVPAITMKLFAEEKKTGTIELLFTKPLSDLQIILAKYFAGVTLVIFSLIPTILYVITIYQLGDINTLNQASQQISNQSNNLSSIIDTGEIIGSYIGLFFLAGIYVAIGIFASALTDNQIIAFLLAMIISFFIYIGFESISSFASWGKFGIFVDNLGINAHYKSISRGVLDTRDIIYFISAISLFLLFTKTKLESRKW